MKTSIQKYKVIISAVCIACLVFINQKLFAQDENSTAGAAIRMNFFEEDSIRKVNAFVFITDSAGNEKPVADAEVAVYAKKSFGLLPLSETQTSDENGEVIIDFPQNLPGDAAGNVLVIAKVEDNDETGSLESEEIVKWGVPVSEKNPYNRRALWASGANAPIPLVITVTSVVLGVWGVIFYVVLLLFKIKKSKSYEIKVH